MRFHVAAAAFAATAAAAPSSAFSFRAPLRLAPVTRPPSFYSAPSVPAAKMSPSPFPGALAASSDDEDEGASTSASISGAGTASIPNEIFNLVKSIVGAGVLSLPAGIAAFGDAPGAVVPAVLLISLIGLLSAYSFSLIGRLCSYTGGRSYGEAWSKSVGESTSWIPASTCTFLTCAAVLSFSMILGDTCQALLASAGLTTTRTMALLGITGTTLLPLCLLKNLSSLAPFSIVGTAGMIYTTIAMAIRYLSGTYKAPAGKFLADVAANYQPKFGSLGASAALSPNVSILICMLSTAYMAHFNAPKFFIELEDNTIERFNTVVGTSFGISVFLFSLISAIGFLTFGSASSGLILNNYSGKDALMGLSRIAVGLSLVFSFPLAFSGAREGWLDLLGVSSEKRSDSMLVNTTLAILGSLTFLATQVKDLAFLLSFAGATLGNALIYVYPALMLRSVVKGMGEKASKSLKREVPFAMFTAVMGVVMGSIGGKMAIGLL